MSKIFLLMLKGIIFLNYHPSEKKEIKRKEKQTKQNKSKNLKKIKLRNTTCQSCHKTGKVVAVLPFHSLKTKKFRSILRRTPRSSLILFFDNIFHNFFSTFELGKRKRNMDDEMQQERKVDDGNINHDINQRIEETSVEYGYSSSSSQASQGGEEGEGEEVGYIREDVLKYQEAEQELYNCLFFCFLFFFFDS